jgi:hypothetical protein
MSRRKQVREPIQVYLTAAERRRLDLLAETLGVSRAEVLRRGLETVAVEGQGADPLDALVGAFDAPAAPRDLAANHDEYLAADEERAWRPAARRRSS